MMTKVSERRVRTFFALAAAWLLAGCVATMQTAQKPQYVQRAQAAIIANNFDGAYRILEDAFLDADPEIRASGIQLYKANSRLREAAIESFSRPNLSVVYSTYGEATAIPFVKRRLTLFAQVASGDELASAYENFEAAIVNHKQIAAEEAKKAAAGAAARKAEEDARRMKEAEELAKRRDEAARAAEREASIAMRAYEEARAKAVFRCTDRSACEKAFAITQVFVTTNSDMKIQIANETVIQTYNPTEYYGVGLSAVKMPRAGNTADIIITVNCKSMNGTEFDVLCLRKATRVLGAFPTFMKSNFIP